MVGDLGLGKAVDMSSRLTMIAGTPTFVAPEQAQGERLDARADQYSLAALTYLLLTGRPPHGHRSLAAAARAARPTRCRRPSGPSPPPSRTSYAAGSPRTARIAGPTWRRSPMRWSAPAGTRRRRPTLRGCSRWTRS